MNDTDPKMESKFKELMMQKTPEERLKMGCSMFSFSKAIVLASIMEEAGSEQPPDLKAKLFLRLYGDDMDKESRDKIATYFLNIKS